MAAELGANAERIGGQDYMGDWAKAANTRAWASSTTVTEAKPGRERANEYERLTASITRQVDAMRIEAETYGMTEAATEQYRAEQELLRAATEAGIPFTGGLIDANRRLAESLADATAKAEGMRVLEELRTPFETMTLEIARLDELLQRGVLNWDQYQAAAARAAETAGLSWDQQATSMLDSIQTIAQASGQQNKAMVRANQVAGIANAIISTHVGITKALELQFPFNLVAAAAVAAKGFASVAAIKSQSSASSSAPSISRSASSSSGASAPVTSAPSAPTQQQAPAQVVHLTLQGSRYTREDVRELVEGINAGVRDGIRLVVSPY
jgi:hypothetical protein